MNCFKLRIGNLAPSICVDFKLSLSIIESKKIFRIKLYIFIRDLYSPYFSLAPASSFNSSNISKLVYTTYRFLQQKTNLNKVRIIN